MARLHWSFKDPFQASTGSEDKRLDTLRRVRDEIHTRFTAWLATTLQCDQRK
jgi:hypothetical protein